MNGDAGVPEDEGEWKAKAGTHVPLKWPDGLVQGKPRPSGRLIFCTRKDVYSAKDPLLESGLIGPVTLQTAETNPAK